MMKSVLIIIFALSVVGCFDGPDASDYPELQKSEPKVGVRASRAEKTYEKQWGILEDGIEHKVPTSVNAKANGEFSFFYSLSGKYVNGVEWKLSRVKSGAFVTIERLGHNYWKVSGIKNPTDKVPARLRITPTTDDKVFKNIVKQFPIKPVTIFKK